jgi:hypothetical protein
VPRNRSIRHATCSHPDAEPIEFSMLFARRRDRPMRSCATSTRQACLMGRNVEDFSSQPTRRTSAPTDARAGLRPSV